LTRDALLQSATMKRRRLSRLKLRVRRLLDRAGIEVRRRGGVRRTPAEVLAHTRRLGFSPKVVFDVGVGWGTPELYEAFPEARHVLVEPLKEYELRIHEIEQRYRAEWVRAAAGPEQGTAEMAVHRTWSMSSMLGGWKGHDTADVAPREVPVVRLDDIRHERGLEGPFVVKVDVEGGELRVLDGAENVLQDTELVLLEVNLFRFLPEAPDFGDVVAYMRERGFVVYDFYGGHLRPLDGALAMTNVVFVKEGGRFRREESFSTPRQAHEMFESWGL
jgi:FkbM family methyltransferase